MIQTVVRCVSRAILGAILTANAGICSTAQAGQSVPVSGNFVVTSAVPVGIEEVGTGCIIELDATFALDGSLEGAFDAEFTILHFGPCDEPAYELFWAIGTYSGSVLGQQGSFDFVFLGEITEAGEALGELIVTSGDGDLDGLLGRIVLSGLAGVGGNYAGRVRFDD